MNVPIETSRHSSAFSKRSVPSSRIFVSLGCASICSAFYLSFELLSRWPIYTRFHDGGFMAADASLRHLIAIPPLFLCCAVALFLARRRPSKVLSVGFWFAWTTILAGFFAALWLLGHTPDKGVEELFRKILDLG